MPREPPGYEGRFDLFGWHLMHYVFRWKPTPPRRRPTLIDLGMGRGRDIIYFGRRGFRCSGVDASIDRIRKGRHRAARLGVPIRSWQADLRTFRFPRPFDVVYSSTSLNCLPPGIRERRFAHFRSMTVPGGLHAVNVFVPARDPRPAPDLEGLGAAFRPGELVTHYSRWRILQSGVEERACRFGGAPHRHAVEYVVARKP